MEAMLVSFIDHGATPPSTLAARNTATTGAPLRACVAAGAARVRAVSRRRHRELHAVSRHRPRAGAQRVHVSPGRRAAGRSAAGRRASCPRASATGIHTRDPRAARLFQMALELEIEGRSHPDDPRRRDGDGRASRRARARGAGQHRRRHRGGVRRHRHPARDRRRAVRHLARARHRGAGAGRDACASTRCARSIRRIIATTARRSGACPSAASSRPRATQGAAAGGQIGWHLTSAASPARAAARAGG